LNSPGPSVDGPAVEGSAVEGSEVEEDSLAISLKSDVEVIAVRRALRDERLTALLRDAAQHRVGVVRVGLVGN
jgi:hypothetical protein